jgi:hypothetical protein
MYKALSLFISDPSLQKEVSFTEGIMLWKIQVWKCQEKNYLLFFLVRLHLHFIPSLFIFLILLVSLIFL